MTKIFTFALLVGIAMLLTYYALFSNKGLLSVPSKHRLLQKISTKERQMREENEVLAARIKTVKENGNFEEGYIRKHFVLIGPNENLYLIGNEGADKKTNH